MHKKRAWLFAVSVFAFTFILAGCGGAAEEPGESTPPEEETAGSTPEEGAAEAQTLEIGATNWAFDQDTYSVASGSDLEIQFTNEEGVHGLQIADLGVNIQQDGSETVAAADLQPGEYAIVCSIPCGTGHADMVSTLVVE